MGQELLSATVAIVTALIGVAIIAVLISKNSATIDAVNSASKAFDAVVSKAVSPVSNSASL